MNSTRPSDILHRVSTSTALVRALRAQILDGTRPLGSRLTEAELAQTHEVSRHSIRIALNEMASLGLVVLKPHKGAWVRQMRPRDIEDLYRLRWLLESEAITHAAMEPATWTQLEACVEDLRRLTHATPWSVVAETDWAFHSQTVASTGSAQLVRAHRLLEAETLLSFIQCQPGDDVRTVERAHTTLLDAIRAGDATCARNELRAHLEESMRSLIGNLQSGTRGAVDA